MNVLESFFSNPSKDVEEIANLIENALCLYSIGKQRCFKKSVVFYRPPDGWPKASFSDFVNNKKEVSTLFDSDFLRHLALVLATKKNLSPFSAAVDSIIYRFFMIMRYYHKVVFEQLITKTNHFSTNVKEIFVNETTSKSVRFVGNCLKNNPSVERLYLNEFQCSAKAFKQCLDAATSYTSVKKVAICGFFQQETIALLSEFVEKSKSVCFLSLKCANTGIKKLDFGALFYAISKSATLKSVKIADFKVSVADCALFFAYLQDSCMLQSLNFDSWVEYDFRNDVMEQNKTLCDKILGLVDVNKTLTCISAFYTTRISLNPYEAMLSLTNNFSLTAFHCADFSHEEIMIRNRKISRPNVTKLLLNILLPFSAIFPPFVVLEIVNWLPLLHKACDRFKMARIFEIVGSIETKNKEKI